jgi:NAD+ diphosphatase
LNQKSFTLHSFEQPLTTTPGQPRCYFIVGEENGRCEFLLASNDESIFHFEDKEIPGSFAHCVYETSLGEWQGKVYWVKLVKKSGIEGYTWIGLRKKLGLVEDVIFMLAGRALQLCQWQKDHAFCGRCGTLTAADSQDAARVCTSCQLRFYPRISPCMIVAVTRGDEILLAYHKRATRPVYSTLAGFVEAGESVEDCVRREVMEEVGVSIKEPKYLLSQPWPFPSQLMLGFIAEYDSGDIRIDEKEILDASWFRYDALPETPSSASVAGQLIRYFVEQQNNKGSTK